MDAALTLAYRDALAISWSVTWRLLLANVVLVLVLAAFTTILTPSFGHRRSIEIDLLYAALEWLLAWPFVARVSFAPQVLFPSLYPPAAFNPKKERSPLRYWPCVVFGLGVDFVSSLPVLIPVVALHLMRVPVRSAALVACLILLIRLFLILPIGVQLLARNVPQARLATNAT